MSWWPDSRPPLELWLFCAGFAVYSILPLVPGVGFLLANPIAPFAAATALGLMTGGGRRSYWVTLALAFGSIVYPTAMFHRWLDVDRPTLVKLGVVFVVPALLLCLLRTERVRAFAGFEIGDADESGSGRP